MEKLDEFHLLVGETLMFCQTVELDIKYIYSAMLKGDFGDNYLKVEQLTLGQVLSHLKELDYSDNNHFFSDEDYNLLKDITKKRNSIVHKTYQNFLYKKGTNWYKAFDKEFKDLKSFHDRMERLSDEVEKIRLRAVKLYQRA